jgi:hypothetical protein
MEWLLGNPAGMRSSADAEVASSLVSEVEGAMDYAMGLEEGGSVA